MPNIIQQGLSNEKEVEVASNMEPEILAGYLTESVNATPGVAQNITNLPVISNFAKPN